MKLTNVHKTILINTNANALWQVLSHYGDVSSFHAGVVQSYAEPGNQNLASLGSERVCNIQDMGLKIQLKERITHYVEGERYRYEVYEWRNFPIRKMFFEFSIHNIHETQCALRLDIDYRAKPGLLTLLLVPKMKSLINNVLLGYKHYAETGELREPIKILKKKYPPLAETMGEQVSRA